MNTNTIFLLVGRENDLEHYAMLIEKTYIFDKYDPSKGENHEIFVKKMADDFANAYLMVRDMKTVIGLNNVYLANGYKISSDGKHHEAGRLEDTKTFISEFYEVISREIERRGEPIILHEPNIKN